MLAKTHITFSLFLISFISNSYPILAMSIFSIVPDLDLLFKKYVQHRTLTHSLFIAIPFLILGYNTNEYLFAGSVAYFSHIVLDLLNQSVTFLFFPFRQPFRMFKNISIRVGSMGEEFLFWLFLLISLFSIFVIQRGTFEILNLNSGVMYSNGLKITNNLKNEYKNIEKQNEETLKLISLQEAEIFENENTIIKYSSFPIDNEKIDKSKEVILNKRNSIEELKLKLLKNPKTITGYYLPLK